MHDGCLCVDQRSCPPLLLNRIRSELTVQPRIPVGLPQPEPFPVYIETITHLYGPRYYQPLHTHNTNPPGSPSDPTRSNFRRENSFSDDSKDETFQYEGNLYAQEGVGDGRETATLGKALSPAAKFQGELKASQKMAVEEALASLQNDQGAVISLHCGGGKTVCAINILALLGRRTLVVVHKEFLMSQWKERIRQFLPGARIGVIRQDKCIVDGCDVVVAMLQSLAIRQYAPQLLAAFGTAIFDECHHISARVFSQAMFHIPAKYLLGLSATPNRKDGLGHVINWFLGPIVYHLELSDSHHLKNTTVTVRRLLLKGGGCPTGRMAECITSLGDSAERNAVVVEEVLDLLEEGRNILILSDRRDHLQTLHDLLRQSKVSSVGFYVGGMTQSALQTSAAQQVLLGTYAMGSEGLDISTLNTLLLATPRVDVRQSVGRILRGGGCEGLAPMILDIVDCGVRAFQSGAKSRSSYYQECGFIVEDEEVTIEDYGTGADSKSHDRDRSPNMDGFIVDDEESEPEESGEKSKGEMERISHRALLNRQRLQDDGARPIRKRCRTAVVSSSESETEEIDGEEEEERKQMLHKKKEMTSFLRKFSFARDQASSCSRPASSNPSAQRNKCGRLTEGNVKKQGVKMAKSGNQTAKFVGQSQCTECGGRYSSHFQHVCEV